MTSRQPAGIPVGGQFAPNAKSRSAVSLGSDGPFEVVAEATYDSETDILAVTDADLVAAIRRGQELGERDPSGFVSEDMPEGLVSVNDAVDRLATEGVERKKALEIMQGLSSGLSAQDRDGRIVLVVSEVGLDDVSNHLGEAQWGQTGIRVGSRSPWGTVDDAREVAPGIASVGTPGHGGIKLSAKRNKAVPEALREPGGWYEEDCEWAKAAMACPEVPYFAAIEQRMSDPDNRYYDIRAATDGITHAERMVRDYYPAAYEAATGRTIAPGQSFQRDDETFAAEHVTSHLGISAISTGDGMVKVTTKIGGHYGHRDSERRTYLVTTEEYSAGNRTRHPFVVDPAKHQRINEDGVPVQADGSPDPAASRRQVSVETAGADDATAQSKQAREMAEEAAERGDSATADYYRNLSRQG